MSPGLCNRRDESTFRHAQSDAVSSTCQVVVRMQYFGQLNDLELPSPVARIESRADVAALVDAFEELYAKVYVRSARSPELGFMFHQRDLTWCSRRGEAQAAHES
jgi:hypothetical protein